VLVGGGATGGDGVGLATVGCKSKYMASSEVIPALELYVMKGCGYDCWGKGAEAGAGVAATGCMTLTFWFADSTGDVGGDMDW